MPVIGNFIAGQILTAANLNLTFSQAANVFGDSFTGNVTTPGLAVTGITYTNYLIANNSIKVNGQDVLSFMQGAYTQANLALITAQGSNSNTAGPLIQAAWNTANAAFATANAAISNTSGSMSGSLTIGGTLNVANNITANTEIHGSANTVVYPGQFRAIQATKSGGAVGVIFRNDGNTFYLLTTGNTTPGLATVVNPNSLQPFSFNVITGAVSVDNTGVGTAFGGNVTTTNLNATSANIAQIRSKVISSNNNYILQPQDSGTIIYYTNNSPIVMNVNNNLFPNFRVVVTQVGTGVVTFQTGSGCQILPRSGTLLQITGQYASASLVGVPYQGNTYILDGSIQ